MKWPVIMLVILAGCATPEVISYDHPDRPGETVYEYKNSPSHPCPREAAACYKRVGTQHAIYYTDATSQQELDHERAHVLGMRHTKWNANNCAYVTESGGKYQVGQILCIRWQGEVVISRTVDIPTPWWAWVLIGIGGLCLMVMGWVGMRIRAALPRINA